MGAKKYRPSKTEYYLNITEQVARRSTCMRTIHGCVVVKNDQIVSTGYNGAPRDTMDCKERGVCLRSEMKIPSGQRYEICRSAHGEQNAIINAARAGVSLYGGDMYLFSLKVFEGKEQIVDAAPCFICKKMIINAGISRVIAKQANGSYKIYDVKQWVKEWQKKDMLDDMNVYDSKYYENKKSDKKVKSEPELIIGLTGGVGSGKGTVSDVLKDQGFEYFLLSDVLREELKRKKKKITRDNLIKLGNDLRASEGFGTLAIRTLKKIKSSKAIIDSIRHPDEVKELRREKNFIMVAVDAPQATRFKRILARNRESDSKSFEEFKDKDYKEMWGQTGSGQQIGKVMQKSDIILKNVGTIEELKAKTLRMLKDIENKI